MSIYTKKGDKGETGLLGGSRIGKDHLKVSSYGTLDEANAVLGIAYSMIKREELKSIIHNIQRQLFVVGAELASDEKGISYIKKLVSTEDITYFEKVIDEYDGLLGPITEFIIPGETTASAQLHQARSIIRRAERLVVELSKTSEIREVVIKYINRLSDVLFMLARAEVYYSLVDQVITKVLNRVEVNPYLVKIDLHLARKLAKAVERKAEEMGVPIVCSIVDEGGNVILLHRMDEALLVSVELAPNKAYTSVALKAPTHNLAPLVQPGADLFGLHQSNHNRIVPFGGGFPLTVNGKIIGGIGVSGGTVEEDILLANCGVKIFESLIEVKSND
ncbi:cob(I)yrinic acid a,c-diamide adenosyltransferase [Robertmurraya korlensis]|uniref:cob(I)yrinic acid a,c-diamide adenosyltransferase n=1 Tax=Robertmurraya korlensis TaxID=519977 RepID=UPI00082417BF|nr:cob(I)yrinic acid a,c-diamide adenosyltransferase [Robertmurraya korlensis]